jgi:hypothetical protein
MGEECPRSGRFGGAGTGGRLRGNGQGEVSRGISVSDRKGGFHVSQISSTAAGGFGMLLVFTMAGIGVKKMTDAASR